MARAIATKVAAAHRAIRASGRAFLGRAAVLAASFLQRAGSHELKFDAIPTFAASQRSVRDGLRGVERDFRARYRAALERWRAGWRDVPFPYGTWSLIVFHAAEVEPLSGGFGLIDSSERGRTSS